MTSKKCFVSVAICVILTYAMLISVYTISLRTLIDGMGIPAESTMTLSTSSRHNSGKTLIQKRKLSQNSERIGNPNWIIPSRVINLKPNDRSQDMEASARYGKDRTQVPDIHIESSQRPLTRPPDGVKVPSISTPPPWAPPLTERPDMVIILTEGRSGSTWLMETLDLPNNSMSFFEPLNNEMSHRYRATKGKDETEEELAHRWRMRIFTGICHCQLSSYEVGSITGWQKNYSPEILSNYKLRQVEKDCLNTDIRIAKPIRLYNATELKDLQQNCPKFKVVHLVRDPRAVIFSRMITFKELYDGNRILGPFIKGGLDAFSNDYVAEAAKTLCENNIRSIKEGDSDWLTDRYVRVRYEDFAVDSVKVAQDLYHFLGQPFTKTIKNLVYKSSHQHAGFGGYATQKNSSLVLGYWKVRLLDRHLEVIDKVCKEYMNLVGYTPGRDA